MSWRLWIIFLGKSVIILGIKSIAQINVQSMRGDNLRPLHRLQPPTRENINLNCLTKKEYLH